MRDKSSSMLTVLHPHQQQQHTTAVSSSDEIDEGCYEGAAGNNAEDVAAARRYRRGDSGNSDIQNRYSEPKQTMSNGNGGERLTAVEDRWKTVFGQMEGQRPPLYSATSYVEQLKRFALMLKDPALSGYVWLAQRLPPPQSSSSTLPLPPQSQNGYQQQNYPNNHTMHAPLPTAARAASMLFGNHNGNYQNYPHPSSSNLITTASAVAAAAKRSRSMPAAPNRLSLSGFFSGSANKSQNKQQNSSSATRDPALLPPHVPSNNVQVLRAVPALATAAASTSSVSSSRSSVVSSSHSADNLNSLKKPQQTAVAANNVADRRAANAAIDSPNLSVLLKRLKLDMKLSSLAAFRVEFIELDGLHWLLEILKAVQEKTKRTCGLQSLLTTSSGASEIGGGERRASGTNSNPQDMKSAAVDELSVLLSIKYCSKSPEALDQLMDMMPAVPCVCNSLASSSVKVRIVVLQILSDIMTRNDAQGFRLTLDAMTTLRLRLSEPVRFKILVGMMSSNGALALPFQAACMHFINKLLACAESANQRVLLQGELEEAGLDVSSVESLANADRSCQDFNALRALREEIYTYKSNYVDVQLLLDELKSLRQAAQQQQQNGSERAVSRASSTTSHSSGTSAVNNSHQSQPITQVDSSYSNGHHHTTNGYSGSQQTNESNNIDRRAPYATAETCYSDDDENEKNGKSAYSATAASLNQNPKIPILPLKTSMFQYRQQQQRINHSTQPIPPYSPRRNAKRSDDDEDDRRNDAQNKDEKNNSFVAVRQVADIRRNFESNSNITSSRRRYKDEEEEDDFVYDEYVPQALPIVHRPNDRLQTAEDEDYKTCIQVQPPTPSLGTKFEPTSNNENFSLSAVASSIVETRAAGRICHRIPEEPEFEHTDREHDADDDDEDEGDVRVCPPEYAASAANGYNANQHQKIPTASQPKVNNHTAQRHLHVRASSNSDSDSGHHSPTATSSTTSSSSNRGADPTTRPKSAGGNTQTTSSSTQASSSAKSNVVISAGQRFVAATSSSESNHFSGSKPALTPNTTTVVCKKQRWLSSESSLKPVPVSSATAGQQLQPSPAEAATLRMMEKVLNEFDKICDTTEDFESC